MLEDPTADWYGLQLSKLAGLATGTIYPALARLERCGWIERRSEDIDPKIAGRPARKLYRFTQTGARRARLALADHVARLTPPDESSRTDRRAPSPRLGLI